MAFVMTAAPLAIVAAALEWPKPQSVSVACSRHVPAYSRGNSFVAMASSQSLLLV